MTALEIAIGVSINDDGLLLVATDGSEKGGYAGWGCYFPFSDISFSERVYGADQTSYASEVEAIRFISNAARHKGVRQIAWVVDNKAVVDGLQLLGNGSIHCPKYAFGKWAEIRTALYGIESHAYWVPSHGKREDWDVPVSSLGSAPSWRLWNAKADSAAAVGRDNNEAAYQNEEWGLLVDNVCARTVAAFERSIIGAGHYVAQRSFSAHIWAKAFSGTATGAAGW